MESSPRSTNCACSSISRAGICSSCASSLFRLDSTAARSPTASGSAPTETTGGSVSAETGEDSVPTETSGGSAPAETGGCSAPTETNEGSLSTETGEGSVSTETSGGPASVETGGGSAPRETKGSSVSAEAGEGSGSASAEPESGKRVSTPAPAVTAGAVSACTKCAWICARVSDWPTKVCSCMASSRR